MAAEAMYVHGDYSKEPWTPGSDTAGGTVIALGSRTVITHRDIAAGELDAVATGGGTYSILCDAAIAAGSTVYWDNVGKRATETSAGNNLLGSVEPNSSSSGADQLIRVAHRPVSS